MPSHLHLAGVRRTLRARLGCPAVLLAVCPDRAVADWCAAPIVIGPPGSVLSPVVLGPDQVPVVTDPDAARHSPELAVLSAIAHGARPDPIPIFEALLAALDVFDHDHADLYTDLVFTVLPAAARDCLEEFRSGTFETWNLQTPLDTGSAAVRCSASALRAALVYLWADCAV